MSATRTREPDCPPRRGTRDGFVIVAVLWILIALATLVSVYSVYVANSAVALSVMDDGFKVEPLVSTGIELAAYQLSVTEKEPRPTRGGFRIRLGSANVAVSYLAENARLDLNAAPKAMLAQFFLALGASNEDAEWCADRIIGWRTAPKRGPGGAGGEEGNGEDALYRSAGRTYLPRGAPFAHVSELWLVHGLPPALIERAMPFVTVYSGRSEIDVFDAPPEVIAALPGMTPARLGSFLNSRETTPRNADALPLLLGPDQAGATAEGSNAVRVQVRIAFDNGRKAASEVVILLGADAEPYRVLSWRNDVDSDQQQAATRLR